jgi:DNA-(apurinic or apyrimidinic site) lyase
MMAPDIRGAAQQITNALEQLPWTAWNQVVQDGPGFKVMRPLAEVYQPGAFLVLMVVAGLNDYQLKGKAESKYWPLLRQHLGLEPVPSSPEELGTLLEPFYREERMGIQKVHRMWRFLRSRIANQLWAVSPAEAGRQIRVLWRQIAVVMAQPPEAKTIAFSIKTLAIGLLLLGEENFEFTGVALPVDSRLLKLTPALDGGEVREFWDIVLAKLCQSEPRLTHLHLDSLLWQYSGASNHEAFLNRLGLANATATVEAFDALLRL